MNNSTAKTPVFYNQAQPAEIGSGKKGNSNKNHLRSILTVVGLTLFFVAAMLGVLIAQRQRVAQGPVAPNAPESKPAASEGDNSCSNQVVVHVVSTQDDSCEYDYWVGDECGGNDCLANEVYQQRTLLSGDSAVCTILDRCINKDSCSVDPGTTTNPTPTSPATPTYGPAEIHGHVQFDTNHNGKIDCNNVWGRLVGDECTWVEADAGRWIVSVTGNNFSTKKAETVGFVGYYEVKSISNGNRVVSIAPNPGRTMDRKYYFLSDSSVPVTVAGANVTVFFAVTDVVQPTNTPTPTSTLAPGAPTNTPIPGQATNTPTPTSTLVPGAPTYTPSPTPTFACNSGCDTDGDCQTVNAEYICSAEYGNKCRLDSNRISDVCEARDKTYVCGSGCDNTDQCKTGNTNYKCSTTYGNVCRLASNEGASNCLPVNYVPATTLAGCNESCESNSNCMYTNYICSTTSAGNKCRLDQYPNSDTCRPPAVVNAYVPPAQQVYIPAEQVTYVQQNPQDYSPSIPAVIPTPAPRADYTPYVATVQPELPEELYQTGPADWSNWLKAGLVTLGLGAALLLLL